MAGANRSTAMTDSVAGRAECAFGQWSGQGVELKRFEHVQGDFPFLAKEDDSSGRHWLYARSVRPVAEGSELEFNLALRPVNLKAVRVRVDIGGKQVVSGTVDFDKDQALQGQFTRLSFTRMVHGLIQIQGACRSAHGGGHVDLGLMFDNGDEAYEYPGAGAQLIVDAVQLAITRDAPDSVKPGRDASTHSRNTDFGRTAHALCKGKGLEIGALHRPFDLDAHVTYLDYDKTESLRHAYRNDPRVGEIRQVQLVWKGVAYPFLDDNAFDFVINSHVLEHVANPGRVIEEWLRVIRPGGVLYMVVPDKDHTFDRPRALTPIAHLMDDFESRLDKIPLEHYEDYIRNREGGPKGNLESLIMASFQKQTSIHVHTFTAESLRMFLEALKPHLGFSLEHFEAQGVHIHVALRKAGGAPV